MLEAIERAETGRIDADLGGGVIKQRVARQGQGRSRGYRTIILFQRSRRAFFVYGFAKNRQGNISGDDLEQFKEAAKYILSLTDKQLAALTKRGDFVEMERE